MNLVGTTHRLGRCLGESEVAHFSGTHQVRHPAYGLLDRHFRIHPMQVIKVNMLHAKPFERFVAGASRILRGAIDTAVLDGRVDNDTELRGEDYAVTPAGQRLAYFDFRVTVDICGIEKVEPHVQPAKNQLDRLDILSHAARVDIGDADAHAA